MRGRCLQQIPGSAGSEEEGQIPWQSRQNAENAANHVGRSARTFVPLALQNRMIWGLTTHMGWVTRLCRASWGTFSASFDLLFEKKYLFELSVLCESCAPNHLHANSAR